MLHTTHFGDSDHYHFIYDINELRFFFDNILPDLSPDEVYFLSLSARKKYMTSEERAIAKLKGTSEMFERRTIKEKNWDLFLRTIRKYEAAEGAYTNDDGSMMDNDKMIIYFNFNPSNVVKAYSEFLTASNTNLFDLIMKRGSSLDYFKSLDRKIMTALHHSRGVKHYIDVDIDYNDSSIKFSDDGIEFMNELTKMLNNHKVEYWCIETHGGYHMLMKTASLKFDYMSEIKLIQSKYSDIIKDVMNNSQGMIPLPGTLQADFEVCVVKGWSSLYLPDEFITDLQLKGDKEASISDSEIILPIKKSPHGHWYVNDVSNPFSVGENTLIAGVPEIIEAFLGSQATEGYFIIHKDPWEDALVFNRFKPRYKSGFEFKDINEDPWTWYYTDIDGTLYPAGLCPVFQYYFPDRPSNLYVKIVNDLDTKG